MAPPDPLTATWPRKISSGLIRPVSVADIEAILCYRSDPLVTRFLRHDPLTRAEVTRRVLDRMSGEVLPTGELTRGVVVEVQGRVLGDAMLRVQPAASQPMLYEFWIGYAFDRSIWNRGVATDVVTELVRVAEEIGLAAYADVKVDNHASQRVLEKAGLTRAGAFCNDGGSFLLYRADPSPGSTAENKEDGVMLPSTILIANPVNNVAETNRCRSDATGWRARRADRQPPPGPRTAMVWGD
jgi:RimJ/RimL family protein N-acetyltransferase